MEGDSRWRSIWVNILDDTGSDAEVSGSDTESGDLGEISLEILDVLEKNSLFFIEAQKLKPRGTYGMTRVVDGG